MIIFVGRLLFHRVFPYKPPSESCESGTLCVSHHLCARVSSIQHILNMVERQTSECFLVPTSIVSLLDDRLGATLVRS
jgi:hypothetical protein